MQLTIPDDIAAEIQREAEIRKLPPEAVALGVLRSRFPANGTHARSKECKAESPSEPKNLREFLGDFVGCIHSSEHLPGGARMSENTAEQFTDILMEERRLKEEKRHNQR